MKLWYATRSLPLPIESESIHNFALGVHSLTVVELADGKTIRLDPKLICANAEEADYLGEKLRNGTVTEETLLSQYGDQHNKPSPAAGIAMEDCVIMKPVPKGQHKEKSS